MWPIFHLRSTLKTKLSYHDWSNWVRFIMKTKQDNDMTNYISAVYVENDTELSWPIGLGAVCEENQIGQQRDEL